MLFLSELEGVEYWLEQEFSESSATEEIKNAKESDFMIFYLCEYQLQTFQSLKKTKTNTLINT